ncbi:MAG: hypothetical protein MHMPM18_002515 [Marteilia pararefringens]
MKIFALLDIENIRMQSFRMPPNNYERLVQLSSICRAGGVIGAIHRTRTRLLAVGCRPLIDDALVPCCGAMR